MERRKRAGRKADAQRFIYERISGVDLYSMWYYLLFNILDDTILYLLYYIYYIIFIISCFITFIDNENL